MTRPVFVALAVLFAMGLAHSALAQDTTIPASIVEGDCASTSVAAELTELVLPTGDAIGAATGRTAASSFTTVPVSFELLTASEHSILAGESCGPIGGSVNSVGALIVVLAGDDGDSGIAYFSPSAVSGQTDVSVFVAPPAASASTADAANDAEIAAVTTATEEVPAPDPTATAEPEPTVAPLGRSESSPAPIGTTVVADDGQVVTILNAYYSTGFGFSTPKGGYTYLVLDVQLQNNGESSATYGESSFSGTDADTGVGYDSVFVVADGTLGSGSLDPGEFVSGAVILEVQQTALRVVIKYDPAMFDPNDLYWSLGF